MQASEVRTDISPEEQQAGAERQRPVVFRAFLWIVSDRRDCQCKIGFLYTVVSTVQNSHDIWGWEGKV